MDEHDPQRVRGSRIVTRSTRDAERRRRAMGARLQLAARGPAQPALDGCRVVGRDAQHVTGAVRARAAGLGPQLERPTEVGDRVAERRGPRPRGVDLGDAALDPRLQLGDRCGRVAQPRPPRQRHLDAVLGIDADADAARPVGAPHGVGRGAQKIPDTACGT